ncbi:MAG: mersacidin/lichenicidin family type 2 lantibiotic [Dolichospermum sp. LBC05a]|nr:mersacidin/lichenicidin family type 2 lantibiotic [Dolichospermum sp. OL01]MCO5797878.1 mersacidin/lichenicidin family type 2 lantibiotic [Dolichospermum sp. OL03]MCS6280587.1 mersacidin/lichenicidin family type 2 lantibiotic [Dolichospermum sp.]QSV59365.1 MAG: mersacidin/lichenicidin family type 2 lantibiotic [Dolichospermum sp. LBC05a]QSV63558.1 MAG: mersacidin/lichenicidin family type 2 lantibiotic [Dolichospermum sp. DL01]
MSNLDIIRAWKDEEFRNSLSAEQQEQLPANPAGLVELNDEDMSSVSGGCTTCGNPLHTLFWTCKAVSSPFDTIA